MGAGIVLEFQSRWWESIAALQSAIGDLAPAHGIGAAHTPFSTAYTNAGRAPNPFSSLFASLSSPALLHFGVTLFLMGAALVVLISTGIVAFRRREEWAPHLLRGLQVPGMMFACVLLVLYAGMAANTVRQENERRIMMSQILHGEGPYFARMLHRGWPPMPAD